ncbi:MAG: hypothetical protein R3F55_19805 [Alphaproteobacteria bacterium]
MPATAGGQLAIAGGVGPDGQPPLLTAGGEATQTEGGQAGGAGGNRQAVAKRSEMDEFIDLAQIEGQVRRESISRVSDLIDQNPGEAVALLRSWLYAGRG